MSSEGVVRRMALLWASLLLLVNSAWHLLTGVTMSLFSGLMTGVALVVVGSAIFGGTSVPRRTFEEAMDDLYRQEAKHRDLIQMQEEQIQALASRRLGLEERVTLGQLGHEEPPKKKSSGLKSFSIIEGETTPHVHLPEPVTTLFTDEVVAHICRECYDECAAPVESGGYYVAVIDEPHKTWFHTTWLRSVSGGPAVRIGGALPY